MTTSISQPERDVFSRSALTNALCNPLLSPATTSNLGERVRRLQEMLKERQSDVSSSNILTNRNACLQECRLITRNLYSLPKPRFSDYVTTTVQRDNRIFAGSNRETTSVLRKDREVSVFCGKREVPAILIERCNNDKTVGRSELQGNETKKTESGLKETKEKSRTVKKYFGNLTSTRYLHSIFSPIIKETSADLKRLRRTVSAKQNFLQSDINSDICAAVVSSESTTQIPVIKRRSFIKEIDDNGINDKNDDSGVADGFNSLRKESDASRKTSQRSDKSNIRGSDERLKPKRRSFISEDTIFKLPFLNSAVTNSCRERSTVFDSNADGQNTIINNAKGVSNSSTSDKQESEKLAKRLSFKTLGVGRNDTSKPNSSWERSASSETVEKGFLIDAGEKTESNYVTKALEIDNVKDSGVLFSEQDKQLSKKVEVEHLTPKESVLIKQIPVPKVVIETKQILLDELIREKTTNYDTTRLCPFSYYRSTKQPLPPVPEIQITQEKSEGRNSQDIDDSLGTILRARKTLKYGRSHTTSTYNGYKDAAPDASPRRHLIGFLHRTSHLSLTSELSADASFYLIGHRGGRRFDDSTIGSESDARLFSDDDERSRVSTSTDITSVSRQHQANAYRKRRNRRKFRQPSRASSFSSITESSMSLDVITVTLNMDTVNFLGISIVGQSSSRGDNGIYVANIMKGGAVALDGRIEPGDMILQVNDISFENFTNDQAVDVLKESVARRGPIKLTVAKMYDGGPRSAFTVPRRTDEPVRPIDTQAWVQHTNAMRGMPSILEGSEGAPTPIPGHYGRPPSSSTVTSNGSAPNTIVGAHMRLDTSVSKLRVVQAMALPNSGLEIKDRTWLKIPIPMSFLGSDLVDWLMEHVDGLRDRKEARKYASDLLKEKLICHAVSRSSFTEQCYYKLGEECSGFVRMRQDGKTNDQGVRSDVGVVLAPQPAGLITTGVPPGSRNWQTTLVPQGAPSMVSGYASMPISPYPTQNPPVGSGLLVGPGGPGVLYKGGPDVHSQTSSADGSSGSENRRAARAILPPGPLPSLSGPHHLPMGNSASLVAGPSVGAIQNNLGELPQDLTSSRQSFRIAMSQPFEFFVDNL